MKSATPVDEVADEEDLFGGDGGGHRTMGSLYLARARPTMISAKYRLKEERRKVLKISVAKLKRIDDPESSLRRSVLINNTVRRLQREARDEKMQRGQPYLLHVHEPHPTLGANPLALALPDLSDALADDDPAPPAHDHCLQTSSPAAPSPPYHHLGFDPPMEDAASFPEDSFPKGVVLASSPFDAPPPPPSEDEEEEERAACGALVHCLDELVQVTKDEDEVDDVHSVLSQFYMPPTPRMLTSIDEEEGGARGGGDEGAAEGKRKCSSGQENSLLLLDELSDSSELSDASLEGGAKRRRLSVVDEAGRPSARKVSRLRRARSSSLRDIDGDQTDSAQVTPFSCGHASIFGELQSVVFHSLIASLES